MKTMHQPVEVIYRKLAEFPAEDLHFTFFQMVYVISGKGLLGINGNRIPYQTGNLMLMTPEDRHNFEIEAATEFLQIRFNRKYIKEYHRLFADQHLFPRKTKGFGSRKTVWYFQYLPG